MLSPEFEAVVRACLGRLRSAAEPFEVWDEVRAALLRVCPLNTFYVVLVNEAGGTYSIPYVWHRSGSPRAGVTGAVFGTDGLTARMMSFASTYRLAEDDGRRFRAGDSFKDEFDALDAVALRLPEPVAGSAGFVVASSLAPEVFSEQVQTLMATLVRVAVRRISADAAAGSGQWWDEDWVSLTDAAAVASWALDEFDRLNNGLDGLVQAAGAAGLDPDPQLVVMQRWCSDASRRLFAIVHDSQRTVSALTPRQRDVAELIAREGLTNEQIAARLGVGLNTVKSHVAAVLRLLEVPSRTALCQVPGLRGPAPDRGSEGGV